MERQVEAAHYEFDRYMSRARWMSVWHQVSILTKIKSVRVLEIGPGPGILKAIMNALGHKVETLDIDPKLNPDYVCSAADMPFGKGEFDAACAFQVLEHMPFDVSLKVLREMCRVVTDSVVISLPDARMCWSSSIRLPLVRPLYLMFENPFFIPAAHEFDGEHYWEINKKGFELDFVCHSLRENALGFDMRTYRLRENPYHRFFVFKRSV
ncbi:class I SAM-dependent methyltransferase [Cycloclasticus pugetii]|uniref:class I SAM-dependent methyltransferase n=1 Tax=Cycloclasticus pugetii TaxID=34068 RepID=UPI003A9373D3